MDGVLSVPHTKITEEQCIPLRKITDDILGQTDRLECVMTKLQHTYVVSCQTIKKNNFSVYPFLEVFPLNKSDIFFFFFYKNVRVALYI